MKKKLNIFGVALALTAASTVVTAAPAVVDQFTTVNSDFAFFGQYSETDGSSVSVNVYTEGTGPDQVTYLRSFVFGGPTGGAIFYGTIPNSAVQITGTSVAVNFDTCTAGYYTSGTCGLINVTVTKDAGTKPMIFNGVYKSTWGDVVSQTAGLMSFEKATVTGIVHGVVLTTGSDAWMGRYNNVSVTVTKGN